MDVNKRLAGWIGGMIACFSLPLSAATFSVNTFQDAADASPGDGACATAAGSCSLRASIQESNALDGADTIVLAAGTYTLSLAGANEDASATGDLDIADDLVINGASAADPAATVIEGGGQAGILQDRILDIVGAAGRPITVTLNGLTVQGGYQNFAAFGGGGICNHCLQNNGTGGTAMPTLQLNSVIVANNFSWSDGAGISNHGALLVNDSLITGNMTPYAQSPGGTGFGGGMGGGIMNWAGIVSINRSEISGNGAQTGGAIYNQDTFVPGIVLLTDSTVRDNFASMGGGIYNVAIGDYNFPGRTAGTPGITIERSTIAANYADIDGGGLYNLGIGTVVVTNSTFAQNQTGGGGGFGVFPNRGGGIYNGGRLLELHNSTIAGNESAATRVTDPTTDTSRGGDELFLNTTNAGGDPATTIPMVVVIENSIVGNGTDSDDNCNGATGYQSIITINGNNIDSGSTCGFAPAQSNINPLIDVLSDNGGPTATYALFSGSPAIDAADASLCPAVDQRGVQRGASCDIGAFEGGGSAPPAPQPPAPPPPSEPVPPPPPVNTAPVARNGGLSLAAGTAADGVMVAVDNEGDVLSYRIVANGSLGTATLTNAATGQYTYTASPGASGTDTITFVANDGQLDSNVATITVNVFATTVPNVAPIAIDGAVSVAPGASLDGILLAVDGDNDPLTYRIVSPGNQGVAALTDSASGNYTYQANATATGTDTFTFVANDGTQDSNVGTVTVTFTASNSPPTAGDGTLSVLPGASVNGIFSGSDSDLSDSLTYILVTDGSKGSVTITNAAAGLYTYTASAGATGTDTFTYKVSDGQSESAVATVTVTFLAGNTPPSAGDGTLSATAGSPAIGRLTATDPDGDPLSFSVIGSASQGIVTLIDTRNGTFQYTADPLAAGSDNFLFRVSDGQTQSNLAAVNVTVSSRGALGTNGNAPPQAGNLSFAAVPGSLVRGRLAATDREGDTLTYTLVRQAAQGTVSLNGSDGSFTYQANAGASGIDSFTYSVADGASTSNTAVVKLDLGTQTSAPAPSPGSDVDGVTASATGSKSGGGCVDPMLLLMLIGAGVVAIFRVRTRQRDTGNALLTNPF
jgi:hypothetical protein